MDKVVSNYINGRWQDPASTDFLEVRNPATAEVLARVAAGSASDVASAVESAAAAFASWRRDAVEFYTDKKVVIERWPKEWSRTF